jgi:hypothetical protein
LSPGTSRAAPYGIGRVRSSLVAYSIGKAITAPLSLLLVLLLAALMPREQYAAYVSAVALLEIGVVLGTFGVEWVMQTALAGIQVRGNAAQLRRAVLRLGALPCVTYTAAGALLWTLADHVSAWLGGVAPVAVLQLAGILLALEGPARVLRDSLMAVLLLQRIAQVSQVVRVVGTCAGVYVSVAWLAPGEPLQAATVLRIEIAVAALALIVAIVGLGWHLRGRAAGQDPSIAAWVGWPSVRFAAHAYVSIVLMLLIGTDVMTTLVARHLGVEATASFGFVVRLLETARRYLPMDLFWGVVRPAAIGRYESGGRDARRLMQDCNRMIDANLIAVAGVFTASVVAGDVLVQLLSGGKVHDAGWLLVCLVPLLAGHTVRRGTELMAYTLGHSARFARAAFACLLAVPLSVLLLTHTGVPHGAPIAVLITDGLFIAVAVHGLRALGDPVQFSLTRWQRLVWTTVLASAAGWTMRALCTGTAPAVTPWLEAMSWSMSSSMSWPMPWALHALDLLAQPLIAAGLGTLAALVAFVAALRGFKVIAPGDTLLIRLQPDPEEQPS